MIPGPSWARHYRAQHIRSCARPGCGAPAAATLRFQPTRREASLVDLDERRTHSEGDLCARHAAALALPRGWALVDERRDVSAFAAATRRPELVVVPEPEPQLAEVETVLEPEPEPAHDRALDALGDLLDARTPLLRRAFQNIMPADDQ